MVLSGAQAPAPGILALLAMLGLLAVIVAGGRLTARLAGFGDDPFFAIVAGYVVLAYALFAVALIIPGAHWQVAAALGVFAVLQGRPGAGHLKLLRKSQILEGRAT